MNNKMRSEVPPVTKVAGGFIIKGIENPFED